MRKYLNFIMISMVLIAFGITGCYETEVAEPISPDGYPTATFATTFTGSDVSVGDTITYVITLDKMSENAITFGVRFDTLETKAMAVESDIEYKEVTIPAYSTTATLDIIITKNQVLVDGKSLRLEVGCFSVGQRYTLNPKTVNPKLDLVIKPRTEELSIVFGWDTPDDDFDCFLIDEAFTSFFGVAATGDNPEYMFISNEVPDGVYFYELDPYSIGSTSNFTVTLGHPDKSIQVLKGSWDNDLMDTYTARYGYVVMKVVKSGTTYTCTLASPF